jgi:DNA-binding CsgD family transcriptional regulator
MVDTRYVRASRIRNGPKGPIGRVVPKDQSAAVSPSGRMCYKIAVMSGRLLLFGLAAAATFAILAFARNLARRRPEDYVGLYFDYLLIAAPLALLGKPLPVLLRDVVGLNAPQADRLFVLFDGLIAKPLWVLALFLLLRCLSAMAGRKPSRTFVYAFWTLGASFLLVAWLSMIRFLRVGFFSPAAVDLGFAVSILEVLATGLVFGSGLIAAARVGDPERRSGLRTFCWIGIATQAVFWALVLGTRSFDIPFMFGVARPVPALGWLSWFLKRGKVPEAPGESASLAAFCSGFGITPRERDIVALVCAGRSNRAIAEALFISVHTVKRHINDVYRKAGVRNRVQLANAVRASRGPVAP